MLYFSFQNLHWTSLGRLSWQGCLGNVVFKGENNLLQIVSVTETIKERQEKI